MFKTFTKIELEELNTKRLLALKNKLHQFHIDDYRFKCPCKICKPLNEEFELIQNQIKLIKEICAIREHLPKKRRR